MEKLSMQPIFQIAPQLSFCSFLRMNSIKLRSKAICTALIMNRVILEENEKKKKRLLFFVLPDLDDGSIRGITRTGTKQVSQLCFVRKLNTIFIAFLNCRIVHIVQTSVFFIKTCHTVLWSTVEK